MANEQKKQLLEYLFELVSDAQLNLWLVSGSGLGAILLTLICITIVRSPAFSRSKLADIVNAWRRME
jgi:hypothetical protein